MRVATIIITRLMPIWIVILAVWGIFSPELFKGWEMAAGPALGFVTFIMR